MQLLTRARAVIDFFFFPFSRLFLLIINAIYLYSVCVYTHTHIRALRYIAAHLYSFPQQEQEELLPIYIYVGDNT